LDKKPGRKQEEEHEQTEPALLQLSIHILCKLPAAISAPIIEQGIVTQQNSPTSIIHMTRINTNLSKHEDESDRNQDCSSRMHQRIKKNRKSLKIETLNLIILLIIIILIIFLLLLLLFKLVN